MSSVNFVHVFATGQQQPDIEQRVGLSVRRKAEGSQSDHLCSDGRYSQDAETA